MPLICLTVQQGSDSDGDFDAGTTLATDSFTTKLLAVARASRRCTLLVVQLIAELLRLAKANLCLEAISTRHCLLLLHKRLLLLL